MTPEQPMRPMQLISTTVAEDFHISHVEMMSPRRLRVLARPRQVAMYLCGELTKHSLPMIGRHFDRDHSTVIHARDKVVSLRISDPDFNAQVKRLHHHLAARVGLDDALVQTVDAVIERLRIQLLREARENPAALLEKLRGTK